MKDYEKMANDFCKKNNVKIDIKFLGCHKNEMWNEDCERDNYFVTIQTPKGTMTVRFWDSISNTNKNKERKRSGLSHKTLITNYEILSCLQKSDVGTIEDFMWDYGYKIREKGDLTRLQNIYKAVTEEYENICKCFTEKQVEELMEIQ